MEFCQALTGSGGWPLTVLLTPDQKPFFAGTYFPKTSRYGRAGLTELLDKVAHIWQENEQELRESAEAIRDAVINQAERAGGQYQMSHESSFDQKAKQLITAAYQQLERSYDSRYGGFGRAPKFPASHALGFLLRHAGRHPESKALLMVRSTLNWMARGGIYDHLGFGFARYSTDDKWLVPHFEKMLYDNALLAYAYLEGFQATRDEAYARVAREIFTYVIRDMTSPEGAFYSAEDADSDGVEGKFYVWDYAEISAALGRDLAELFAEAYGFTPQGNFDGKNIPNLLTADWSATARRHGLTYEELVERLARARSTLLAVREQRTHPHKDDKILTAWNGLMIAALAKGAQVLGSPAYLHAAERSLSFIVSTLRRADGRLLARYRQGESAYLAYLDDYAYLVWGVLELYQSTGEPRYLELALQLQEEQDELFLDRPEGGYYFTGNDAETLLRRPKELADGALPSGNSISAWNLLRLARLCGTADREQAAEREITKWLQAVGQYPAGHTAYLQAVQFALEPSQELILAGPLDSPRLRAFKNTVHNRFLPFTAVLYQEGTIHTLVPWAKNYPFEPPEVTAYLCTNFACHQPVRTPAALDELLKNSQLLQ